MKRTAMKLVFTLVMALGIGWASVSAADTGAVAASGAGNSDPLATVTSVKVKDQDIREVLATVFQAMKADCLLTGDVTGTIMLSMENAPVRDILDTICAGRGLHWWKKGNTYIVSTQSPLTEETSATAVAAKTNLSFAPEQPLKSEGTTMRWRYYNSKCWNPRDLASLFNDAQEPGPEGLGYRIKFTGMAGQLLGVASPRKRSNPLSDRLAVSDVRSLGESSQFPGLGGGLGMGMPLGTAPQVGGGLGQQPTGAAALQQGYTPEELELLESGVNLQAPFAALLPRGMTAPVAYEPLNYLIFEATDEAYDRFLELVRIFDVKPKQVLLDVQFVTMSVNDAFSFGIDWFWNIGRTALSVSGLAPDGNVVLRVASGEEFAATLSTLLIKDKARLVTAPKIMTSNNFPATINFVTSVPYVEFGGAVAVPNGGTIGGGAAVQWMDIPIALSIMPRVNADDSVTALLNPVVSSFTSVTVPTPDGGTQTVPQPTTNSLTTLLNIKDGETMVIGGFVNRNESVNRVKVPLLADLPLIGSLFQSVDRRSFDSELLIFVTPHVIKDEYTAGTSASF